MASVRYTYRTFSREIILVAIGITWWIPFYLLVVVALTPSNKVFNTPGGIPSHLNFKSFSTAWNGSGGVSLGRSLINSLEITIGTVFLLIGMGSACAYTIGRRPGRLGGLLYVFFVLGIILPYQLAVVPSFVFLRTVGLVPSQLGLIVLYTGLLMPLTVFMYTSFVRALPRDYEEAARVDGARPVRVFIRVVFPQLKPITATTAILTGLMIWNDFFLQLIFLNGSGRETLPVEIYSFVGEFTTQWNLVFAAVIVALIPALLFFLLAQRQIVRGFGGGIKG